jgi:hypothetical protein
MKKLLTSLIFCLLTCNSFCQATSGKRDTIKTDIRKNSVFFEAVGNGSFYSINYERLFPIDNNKGIGLRIGYAYVNASFSVPEYYYLIPGEISFVLGNKHCLDVGCGLTSVRHVSNYNTKTERRNTFNIRIGYRFRGDKGLIIRVAPIIKIGYNVISYEESAWISGGFGIGYSF